MSNQLREALVIARAGLVWYQENYPETFSECDNEALEQIDAALASQAQQDKEANSNRLTDAQIEDIGKEILNHGTHEWEGLQPWVYVFARRIASVSEQLLGNLEEFKLSEAQQDHIPDGGKMVQQTESQWISVEERLPEMAQKVFGIYDAGMCAFMRVRSEDDTWCWAIGRNDLYDDFFYDVDDDYQVTHWMPLPPAPEGE